MLPWSRATNRCSANHGHLRHPRTFTSICGKGAGDVAEKGQEVAEVERGNGGKGGLCRNHRRAVEAGTWRDAPRRQTSDEADGREREDRQALAGRSARARYCLLPAPFDELAGHQGICDRADRKLARGRSRSTGSRTTFAARRSSKTPDTQLPRQDQRQNDRINDPKTDPYK
jgi:hypothetical protein